MSPRAERHKFIVPQVTEALPLNTFPRRKLELVKSPEEVTSTTVEDEGIALSAARFLSEERAKHTGSPEA